jgi:hypothetical protein
MKLRFPGPQQQFVETVDGMSIDHAREHIGEVSVRLDAFSLQVSINEQIVAQRAPPPSLPRLHDLVANAAGIFRSGDAHDAQLRRHPVQHLADAFADGMERTTTTAAEISGDIEPNVLARQMIGQRLAPRPRFERLCCNDRTAFLDAGDVAVEIFKRERQLRDC